ncbi:MAG: hypothetical protein ACI4OJ_04020 [Lachnospiraceae bacterium]
MEQDMPVWTVKDIREDDYGCEELPEGEKVKVLVTLQAEDGTQRVVRAEDALLYERAISVGSRVIWKDHALFPA